jgi:hypothetical protein
MMSMKLEVSVKRYTLKLDLLNCLVHDFAYAMYLLVKSKRTTMIMRSRLMKGAVQKMKREKKNPRPEEVRIR